MCLIFFFFTPSEGEDLVGHYQSFLTSSSANEVSTKLIEHSSCSKKVQGETLFLLDFKDG